MSTIFTKIINREINASIVFEDDEVLAFNDVNPQAPVHVLIIPKKEIATLNDLAEEDAALVGKLHLVAAKIAREKGIAEDGYRVVMNCNDQGGQSVYHIHLHLMGGRQMSWPAG
ncbi:histidine triad nucleotide-binding protein [Kushneria marisflavi]|uniref:Histidine triad nucleotide-binding protein n=1 Tax=Kushneria marisflavi TaxID=157779 RepID=A0A240UKY5_9GAMM|nr:histidine triad nucleotide-binding protein [Kushneria marisflavi]ART62161.1 histidine triad nucleotide-binding protein [Kushneria marisflavi]RKD87241.1 histidine triad (HIT) family protein [Kushneria marisflavi]